jgi:hypothetical protein
MPCSRWLHTRMAQHTQINKCNISHKQNKHKNYMIIPIDAGKAFEKLNILS